ncbi:ABC transporter substrate-binding protein [Paenibacillus sp. NRS-1781]|uniref:ABC transporter substrate-binding protein n=1 Tax=unclassified Paenibacillus TaxID=185978 RepID=UPI003D271D5E
MSKRAMIRLGTVLLAFTFVLAACSNASNQKEAASSAENQESSGTRVVKDAFGDVTIPTHPKNMLVMSSKYAEYLIEMGITPQMVSFVPEIEPAYRLSYFEKHGVKMIQEQQYQMNYEELLRLSPDLIITQGEGMDAQVYEKVSRIAPTIALQAGSGMYDAMPKLADLFDKKTESEKVLAEFGEKATRAREKIHQAIENKTVLILRVDPKQYRYLGSQAGESSEFFYKTLGLKIPEIFKDSKDWFTPFSLEILPEIKPDFIFLEKRMIQNYNSADSLKSLEESPLWKNMDAVKNNHVFPLKTSDFVEGEGPIGSSLLIDYVVEKLVP